LNTLDTAAERYIQWSEVPDLEKGCSAFEVTDIWSGLSLGCVEGGIKKTVDSHDNIGYVVGKKCTPGFPWRA
jgi:alpha-galactosidase